MNIFSSVHNSAAHSSGDNIRGEYGEQIASLFFIQHGFRVSPVQGDWYPYDMIVERHGEKHTIQVKTTTFRKGSFFKANFSKSDDFDAACIVTATGDIYVIPHDEIRYQAGNARQLQLVVNEQYDRFKLGKFQGFTLSHSDTEANVVKLDSTFAEAP